MTDIMYKINYTELHMSPNKVRYIRIIKPLLSQYDRSPSVSFETCCCSGEKNNCHGNVSQNSRAELCKLESNMCEVWVIKEQVDIWLDK